MLRFSAFTFLLLTSATLLHGASQTWDGGSELNGKWSTAANWVGDAAPGSLSVLNSPDVATFNQSVMANGWGSTVQKAISIDSAFQNIGGITFTGQAASYFIGSTTGNSLKLSHGGTIQINSSLTSSGVVQTINAPLQLQGTSYIFTNNAAAGRGTLVFGGGITGKSGTVTLTLNGSNTGANTISGSIADGTASSLSLVKSGAGTWVLSGANAYEGGTIVRGGTLKISGSGSISHAGAQLIVGENTGENATLEFSGGSITASESLLGRYSGGQGTARITGGTWTTTAAFTVAYDGSGVLDLSGTGSINSGSGSIGNSANGVGTANVTGGTWTSAGTLLIGNSGTGVLNLSGTGSINSGGGSLGNNGSSASGTANVTGGTWTSAGTLLIGNGGTGVLNLSGSGSISVNGSGLGNGAGSRGTANVSGGTWTTTGLLTIGNNGSGMLDLGGTGSISSGSVSIAIGTQGEGTANVSGGTWTSNTTFTIGSGGTGTLNLSGTGKITSGSGSLGNSESAKGTANVSGGVWTIGSSLSVGNSGTGLFNLSGTGSVNSNGGNVGNNAGSQGTVNVTGGVWTINNSFNIGNVGTGVMTLSGGTVHVGGVAGTGTVQVGRITGSGGTLNFGAGGSSVGTLNAAAINGGNGTAVVNFNHTAAAFTPAPRLEGSLSVNHLGLGTTILTGENTYTGGTIISAGGLRVSNTAGSATGSGPVTLASGATLSGSGTINAGANAITLNGNLSIGDDNSAAADLALGTTGGSGIVLGSTGSMTFTLFSGAGAGDNTGTVAASDRLLFSGDVTIQPGAKLVIENPTGMTGFSSGDQWRLWDFATVGTRLGTFDEVNIVGPALEGVNAWSFDTSTGILSIVPEPGRASLLLLGLVAALLRRRCASTT